MTSSTMMTRSGKATMVHAMLEMSEFQAGMPFLLSSETLSDAFSKVKVIRSRIVNGGSLSPSIDITIRNISTHLCTVVACIDRLHSVLLRLQSMNSDQLFCELAGTSSSPAARGTLQHLFSSFSTATTSLLSEIDESNPTNVTVNRPQGGQDIRSFPTFEPFFQPLANLVYLMKTYDTLLYNMAPSGHLPWVGLEYVDFGFQVNTPHATLRQAFSFDHYHSPAYSQISSKCVDCDYWDDFDPDSNSGRVNGDRDFPEDDEDEEE